MKQPEDKGSVLLVDDEADIREVLEISLRDSGYTVMSAENGDEALRVFRTFHPSLVLTDIKMPNMDGIELLRRIKREDPETEVIMITGHGDMDLAIESLKSEATDFITKPINVDALEIALKRAAERILIRRKLREYTESLEQLIREKSELQDHLSSLGLLIGTISHGIKGLLTGLDGGMYLLDSGLEKKDPAQIKEGWDVVKLMAERIRKMVLDILFYAKKRDLKWEQVDVLTFAGEVALVVEPKAKAQGIAFVREFDPAIGRLEIDAGFVQSALTNILENAVDACSRDTAKSRHCIVFRLRAGAREILFEIEDDGIGMDAQTRDNIFKLFYSSKGPKGTGLGLFISEKIIQQHGGRIEVASAPGKGTTFTIHIPRVVSDAFKEGAESRP